MHFEEIHKSLRLHLALECEVFDDEVESEDSGEDG